MPLDPEERRLIDELFVKLAEVERKSPPRDPDAEALIERQVRGLPGAAYLMSQTIIVQERALENAQARIAELESAASGSRSGGLFGGSRRRAPPSAAPARAPGGPWGQRRGGGGFLAGAAQTAAGVAGGVVLGSLLLGAFGGDEAEAALPDDGGADAGIEDAGADVGGDDFGGGDFGDFGDF